MDGPDAEVEDQGLLNQGEGATTRTSRRTHGRSRAPPPSGDEADVDRSTLTWAGPRGARPRSGDVEIGQSDCRVTVSCEEVDPVRDEVTVATGMPPRELGALQPAGHELLAFGEWSVGRDETGGQRACPPPDRRSRRRSRAWPEDARPTTDWPSVMRRTVAV